MGIPDWSLSSSPHLSSPASPTTFVSSPSRFSLFFLPLKSFVCATRSVYLPVCPPVCLPACLPVCECVCLFVRPFFFRFNLSSQQPKALVYIIAGTYANDFHSLVIPASLAFYFLFNEYLAREKMFKRVNSTVLRTLAKIFHSCTPLTGAKTLDPVSVKKGNSDKQICVQFFTFIMGMNRHHACPHTQHGIINTCSLCWLYKGEKIILSLMHIRLDTVSIQVVIISHVHRIMKYK